MHRRTCDLKRPEKVGLSPVPLDAVSPPTDYCSVARCSTASRLSFISHLHLPAYAKLWLIHGPLNRSTSPPVLLSSNALLDDQPRQPSTLRCQTSCTVRDSESGRLLQSSFFSWPLVCAPASMIPERRISALPTTPLTASSLTPANSCQQTVSTICANPCLLSGLVLAVVTLVLAVSATFSLTIRPW